MDFNRPLAALFPGPHADALTVLASTEKPLTGRAVARILEDRASLRTVQKALADLESQGIVLKDVGGRSYLYRMNRNHLAAAAVSALLGVRATLVDELGRLVRESEPKPTATWIYGSFARREGHSGSDIDVLLLRDSSVSIDDAWTDTVAGLGQAIEHWSGTSAEIVEYSPTEFAAAYAAGNSFAGNVVRDAIVVNGSTPREVVQYSRPEAKP